MGKLVCLFLVTAATFLSPAVALAQTKFSGTCFYLRDEQHMLAVGDRDRHALGVAQGKCNWTKPIDFGGDKVKDAVFTTTIDAESGTSRFRGVLVITTRGGDRVSLAYRATGTTRMRFSESSHMEGTFTLGEGTGKLKNATGKGTFRCNRIPEGNACDIEGEYQAAK